jgi:hypothetical protein
MKDNFLDLVPNRQPRRQSSWVCYYPNRSPLLPVQGRLYVLAAVILVGEDKLSRRRTSQASRVSDPLERGTWSLRGACGLDRIRPNRVYDVSIVQPAGTSTFCATSPSVLSDMRANGFIFRETSSSKSSPEVQFGQEICPKCATSDKILVHIQSLDLGMGPLENVLSIPNLKFSLDEKYLHRWRCSKSSPI